MSRLQVLSMPTVRKNNKLPYEGSVVLKEHHPLGSINLCTVTRSPLKNEPVYYYNGWGLPTQKCYVDAVDRQLPPNIPPPTVTAPRKTQTKTITNFTWLRLPPPTQNSLASFKTNPFQHRVSRRKKPNAEFIFVSMICIKRTIIYF